MMKRLGLVLAIVIAALGLGACGSEGPAMKKARELAKQTDDQRDAGAFNSKTIARQVTCGSIAKQAFNPATGKARYWFARSPDGLLECFDSAGYYRGTGKELEEFNETVQKEILEKKEYYPEYAAIAYTRPAVQTPTPTPPPPPDTVAAPANTPDPSKPILPVRDLTNWQLNK